MQRIANINSSKYKHQLLTRVLQGYTVAVLSWITQSCVSKGMDPPHTYVPMFTWTQPQACMCLLPVMPPLKCMHTEGSCPVCNRQRLIASDVLCHFSKTATRVCSSALHAAHVPPPSSPGSIELHDPDPVALDHRLVVFHLLNLFHVVTRVVQNHHR